MPRKPRIEIPGYYHIINRGVEQRAVFGDNKDYEYFIVLLCSCAKDYDITIHNYCLMNNHYHLLIEIEHENLSKFMRQINSHYAIYFNKRYNRSGHLWQGRFKSWYVTDEEYLYTLILYIEQNPLKANMAKVVEEYPYSSAHIFCHPSIQNERLNNSWITLNFQDDIELIKEFLNSPVDTAQLQEFRKASNLLEAPNTDKKLNDSKLKKLLDRAKDIKMRNKLILKAYQQGYSQHMIAKVLGLAQPTVQRIIARTKGDCSISIT